MGATPRDPGGVRVLHKTLDVLETIAQSPAEVRLGGLARQIALPKATVFRILNTLEARGYLDRSEAGGYRLARKLAAFQTALPSDQALRLAALPLLDRLAGQCRETVNLGIRDAGDVLVLETVESPQAVRMSSKAGNRRSMHSTALGKVLLAGMAEKEALRLLRLKGMPRLTPHTLTTTAALLEELTRVRAQGFAIDDQENEMEGRCIAVPIRAPERGLIAALSVSGPVYRMDLERTRSFLGGLEEISEAIARAISAR
jgi:DNA-binding IclR family transcriptional regulator